MAFLFVQDSHVSLVLTAAWNYVDILKQRDLETKGQALKCDWGREGPTIIRCPRCHSHLTLSPSNHAWSTVLLSSLHDPQPQYIIDTLKYITTIIWELKTRWKTTNPLHKIWEILPFSNWFGNVFKNGLLVCLLIKNPLKSAMWKW